MDRKKKSLVRGTAGWRKLEGEDFKRDFRGAKVEIDRRCAQVADEVTPPVVGLVESEYLLATTDGYHLRSMPCWSRGRRSLR